jgi:hypothetical protein
VKLIFESFFAISSFRIVKQETEEDEQEEQKLKVIL